LGNDYWINTAFIFKRGELWSFIPRKFAARKPRNQITATSFGIDNAIFCYTHAELSDIPSQSLPFFSWVDFPEWKILALVYNNQLNE